MAHRRTDAPDDCGRENRPAQPARDRRNHHRSGKEQRRGQED